MIDHRTILRASGLFGAERCPGRKSTYNECVTFPEQNSKGFSHIVTFRKLLQKIGYRYDNINRRECILQREDITAWRGSYLKKMLRNDNTPHSRPVIYTVETWINLHSRIGKGFVFKRYLYGIEFYSSAFCPLNNFESHGQRNLSLH